MLQPASAIPAPGFAPAPATSASVLARIATAFRRIDARLFQILFLGTLLLFGALLRDFALDWRQVVLTFAAGLGAQGFERSISGDVTRRGECDDLDTANQGRLCALQCLAHHPGLDESETATARAKLKAGGCHDCGRPVIVP